MLFILRGTTNKPKGIGITHKNLLNYIYAFKKEFNLTKEDVVLQQFTYSFDAFVEEVYPALTSGASIVLADKNKVLNINKLVEYININKVTLISCTPLLLNEINKINKTPSVKTYISGGDVLKKEYFSNLIKDASVYNTYGPTEATVCSCYYKCSEFEGEKIPIGKSILNYKNYIVSKDNQLLPINMTGELAIGGYGVSKGYINNPELNKEKFIVTSFSDGNYIYKTGDLCKINKDGYIEYIGRIDEEIKLRGFRINIHEVEITLAKYPGISNCIINLFEDKKTNKKYLCAYYTGVDTISRLELKKFLMKFLPNYMIPEIFIYLKSFPLNMNGKLDTKELPNPKTYMEKQYKNYVQPENIIEEELSKTWSKIIGTKNISTKTNLFELGIDSLSIISFQTRVLYKDWNINTQDFYDYPTIKEMAIKIAKSKSRSVVKEINAIKNIKIADMKLHVVNDDKIINVFLTGSTGFLGIHILNDLINKTNYNIYCLIRGKDNNASKLRLEEKYNFYFNKSIIDNNRVTVISGDITKEHLGLNKSVFEEVNQKVDTVIHSAALVKHYGSFEMFKENNVKATNNIIKFCLINNKKLHYISTISVSGTHIINNKYSDNIFNENCFYIGQDYDSNVYVKSKFYAEYNVLKAIKEKGLYAKIFRVGNVVGRYSDGVFQQNIDENAFYNKLKSIIKSGYLDDSISEMEIDMSPVDIISLAVVKLLEDKSGRVIYHILHPNQLDALKIVEMLNKTGFKVVVKKELNESLSNKTDINNYKIEGLEDDNYMFDKEKIIVVQSEITKKILEQKELIWPNINLEYFTKIIGYIKNKKFI